MTASQGTMEPTDQTRQAEHVLRKFGYSRVTPDEREPGVSPAFWVQEAGVPRRTFPVFLEGNALEGIGGWRTGGRRGSAPGDRAILVVPSDRAAEEAWDRIASGTGAVIDSELAILVLPAGPDSESPPHWHPRVVGRAEILRLATGVVVGMFRQAQATEGTTQVDFEEMLSLMRARFGVDVHGSLGVRTDEDALFMIYQMALRHSYAPGDPGANLHLLVLKPTGAAARLPWFAA